MRFKLAILLLAFIALSAFAAESKHDKGACNAEANAAVANAKLKHPADVTKVKRDTFNACMAARAHPGGKIRAK